MIKISTTYRDEKGLPHLVPWWQPFRFATDNYQQTIQEYGGSIERNSSGFIEFLVFENEEDATLFLLRWS